MAKRGLIGPLFVVLAAGVLARRWLDVVEVRGRSMAPALLPGDRLVAMRLTRSPRQGDVVLAPDPRHPQRELVKRVASASAGAVVLRGDNSPFSTDAREFGGIPPAAVRWRIVFRYWPRRRIGPVGRAAVLDRHGVAGASASADPSAMLAGE